MCLVGKSCDPGFSFYPGFIEPGFLKKTNITTNPVKSVCSGMPNAVLNRRDKSVVSRKFLLLFALMVNLTFAHSTTLDELSNNGNEDVHQKLEANVSDNNNVQKCSTYNL